MSQTPEILCGVSGWEREEWNESVYPKPKPRRFHPLEYLARHSDAVEIGSTFHEVLRPEVASVWAKKVANNPCFQFTAKLNKRFTHDRALAAAGVEEFCAGLRPLQTAGKLGCVLMQFPWSFRYTEENRRYFVQLRRAFHKFPLVAEMRHVSWMHDEAIGAFIDYRVGFCNIDQPAYTKAMPPTSFLTSGIAYVRLHGRNSLGWYGSGEERRHRYDYLYSKEELQEWSRRIGRIAPYSERTFVIANNASGGKAFLNALELQAMLKGESARQPPIELAQRYATTQPPLFAEYHGRAVA